MPPISTQPGRLSPSSTSAIFTLKITHNAMSSHAAISFLILIQPSMSCCFLLSSKKLPPFRRYPPDSIRCLFHLTPLSLSCPAFSGVWKLSCKKTRRLVVFSAIIVQTAEKNACKNRNTRRFLHHENTNTGNRQHRHQLLCNL